MTFVTEICEKIPAMRKRFQGAVHSLVRMLRNLMLSAQSSEYDVSGITDPFLQTKVLRLLRILGEGDKEAAEAMSDILAQVATNTDMAKTAGATIMYECVLTIMGIKADSGLRVLAINNLGRFLMNRDNNIKYVALTTLARLVSDDFSSVQRHRGTIVECLKDPDISIRRRALDLVYLLVNKNNVRILVRELINYLMVSDLEFKPDLTAKVCLLIDRFYPSKQWRVDMTLKVLMIAGNYVRDDVIAGIVSLIANNSELQGYSARRLYLCLKRDSSQVMLVHLAVWCLGEYGDEVTGTHPVYETITEGEVDNEETFTASQNDVITTIMELMRKADAKAIETRQYIINALAKLSARFGSVHPDVKEVLSRYSRSTNLDLQQRAIEFSQILKSETCTSILEPMPAPEDQGDVTVIHDEVPKAKKPESMAVQQPVDLLGDLLGEPIEASPSVMPEASSTGSAQIDLLSELMGSTTVQSETSVPNNQRTLEPVPSIVEPPSMPTLPQNASTSEVDD